MAFTLKQLIYSKMADNELTQQLLQIADSPTWVEDLIDLIISGNIREETLREIIKLEDEAEESAITIETQATLIKDLKQENEELEERLRTIEETKKSEIEIGGILCPTNIR